MKNDIAKRIVWIFVALSFLLAVGFAVIEANHDCCDGDCAICAIICHNKELSKVLGLLVAIAVTLKLFAHNGNRTFIGTSNRNTDSLINLKVKLSA